MNVRSLVVGIGLFSLGCFSSDARFVEVAELPDNFPYLGSSHTSWVSDGSLFVEIEQVEPPRVYRRLHLLRLIVDSCGSFSGRFPV
jgi:hypothetical protein